MSEIVEFNLEPEGDDPTLKVPRIELPDDMRPDLSVFGVIEIERGVCEDTFENRSLLRRAQLQWDDVYDHRGKPTGLIAARSKEATRERRLMSVAEKKPLLLDPRSNNSDFLTGVDLIIDESACRITPPWVIGATKTWIQEQQDGGPKTNRRAPAAKPHRCRHIKSDNLRCLLWSSGRIADDGLCRVHLGTVRKPSADIERARYKLMQSAPRAVDVLEELMESATSEPVRLKASAEILDRAGVRGGMEIDVGIDTTGGRAPHVIVAERLQRLAEGASNVAAVLAEHHNVIEAEVVLDSEERPGSDE